METTTKRAIDAYTGRYTLKPCKKSWLEQFDKNHDGVYLFEGAAIVISPEIDKDTNLIKTGLSRQEQAELERELGLKEGELSPYSKFWGQHRTYPKVTKEGVTLDLDRSPMDKLRYLYLRQNSKVAQSSADALENPQAEIIMTSVETEAKASSTKISSKITAMRKLTSMSIEEQIDFLKVFDGGINKVTKSASPDTVLSIIGRIADEQPDKFMELAEDKSFKDMLLVQECVNAGLVKKTGMRYTIAGGDVLGTSFSNAVDNIGKPENSEIKIGLKAKLQTIK